MEERKFAKMGEFALEIISGVVAVAVAVVVVGGAVCVVGGADDDS